MRILALDSCSRAGGAAVLRDGQILGSVMLDCGYTHSETLLVSVNDLLSSLRMKLRDMEMCIRDRCLTVYAVPFCCAVWIRVLAVAFTSENTP